VDAAVLDRVSLRVPRHLSACWHEPRWVPCSRLLSSRLLLVSFSSPSRLSQSTLINFFFGCRFPMGLQIVGKPQCDLAVLRLAKAFELNNKLPTGLLDKALRS